MRAILTARDVVAFAKPSSAAEATGFADRHPFRTAILTGGLQAAGGRPGDRRSTVQVERPIEDSGPRVLRRAMSPIKEAIG
jgi:hypothetical protein